jgi:hypothetical protein
VNISAISESRGNFRVTKDGSPSNIPEGGFTASTSLQDEHNSTDCRVGRHCGTLHEYNREAPEEVCFDLPEILGPRPHYTNISLDEISYPLRFVTIVSLWK